MSESTTALAIDRGERDTPLLDRTIAQDLARVAAEHGDRDALVDVAAGRRWSYRQFRHAARALATGLLDLGVCPGDRVGIWGPNAWQWTLTQYATAEIGAILVNINPAYRQHELDFVLEQSGCCLVVASPAFRSSDYPAMLQRAAASVDSLQRTIVWEGPDWEAVTGVAPDDERLAAVAAGLSPRDAINIQYTSGTTGRPKGATLTHSNVINNGFFIGEVLHYTPEDRVCIPVPLYHCFGMVIGNLACTTHGATMVLPGPVFSPREALAAVAQERCTSLYGVPTMFIAELGLEDLDSFDLSTLRTGVMAGSPCPEQIMRRVIDRMNMAEVSICYGMTETSPVSTQTRTDDSLAHRVSTVGRAGPHVEVRIADPATGETLPRGVPGEYCTRGFHVMRGYWRQPERTAEVIDADGWMHSGDLGVMAEDGYVEITGRIKDMVIRGGENIYPREVEEFLYTHPDVVDVQVVGVPDERYGEELMAWIRLREGAEPLTAEAVREFCTGRLAHFKIPRYIHLTDEFPMTVTNKVRKAEMREQSVKLLGLGD